MSSVSQHGPTHAKAILHINQATDTYTLSSPASSDFTPPLTQSTLGSNNSPTNSGSTSQSPPQLFIPPSRNSHPRQYHRSAAINRSRTRYPADLARVGDGRTPLHRRGTSQKYEPFEDLLREAGYKETRIFTPEAERVASGTGYGEDSSSGKSKVAGVVDFLSGFIPGSRSSSLREGNKGTKEHYSPPASPSPSSVPSYQKQDHRAYSGPGRELLKQPIDDDATPRAARICTSVSVMHNNHSYTSIRQSSSSGQMPPPLSLSKNKNSVYLDQRPSRATAYLRHIASVPDIPRADLQRSQSNPAPNNRRRRLNRKSGTKDPRYSDEDDSFNSVYEGRTRGNGEGEEDTNVPPLPKGWLENVARAVLFGSGGSSSLVPGSTLRPPEMMGASRVVSQPHPNSQPSSYTTEISPALRQLRQTRSNISRAGSLADATTTYHRYNHNLTRTQSARSALSSRSGLSDRTNRMHENWTTAMPSPLSGIVSAGVNIHGVNRPRPTLMTRLDSSTRSNASDGEIRKAKVVCRSAPASRTSSPNPNLPSLASNGREGRRKQSDQGRRKSNRSKSKSKLHSGKAADKLPSLTRTTVELEGDGADYMDKWLPPSPRRKLQQARNYPSELKLGQLSKNRYFSGWDWDSDQSSALPTTSQADYDSDGIGHFPNPPLSLSISVTNISDEADQSASDGEESPVDLARMLRPKPERQESSNSTNSITSLRSIRSLRKFLVPLGGVEGHGIPPVPPLPSSCNLGIRGYSSARNTYDFTPPTSASGDWLLDNEGSYADGNDRYGTKSVRGKRGSLPGGWIGTERDVEF